MPVPPPQSQANSAPARHILLLPGLLNDGRLFSSQIAALQENGHICQAVTVDFADSVAGLAAGVLARAPDRFSLVALSMGGYVALEIVRQLRAAGRADRLERLALLNTQARADSEETRRQREGLIQLAQLGRFKGVTPRLLPRLLGEAALANTRITTLIMQMAEGIGREGFVRQQRAILSRVDSRDLLPAIAAPALVIGGREDRLTPPPVIEELAAGIPHAQLHLLDRCGHLSPLEQEREVTERLTDFFG